MKISFLIIGIILFFLGAFIGTNFFIAVGIILIIISFFGKVGIKETKKELIQQKGLIRTKRICASCGAELLPGDNFCPECGKKVLP